MYMYISADSTLLPVFFLYTKSDFYDMLFLTVYYKDEVTFSSAESNETIINHT